MTPSPHTRRRRTPVRGAFLAAVGLTAAAAVGHGWRSGGPPGGTALGAASRAVHAQPAASSGPAYALPALNFQGATDICPSWIAVQNVGDRPGQPIVVHIRGPIDRGSSAPILPGAPNGERMSGVSCGGLLRPGAAWNFFGAQIASGGRSGLVLSLAATTMAAAGADTTDGDDVVGGRLCQLLRTRLANDPLRWQAFVAAWQAGGTWEGVPLGHVAGPPLNVQVYRACPGHRTPGVDVSQAYGAPRIVPSAAASHRAVFAPLTRTVRVNGWPDGGWLYVQNTGDGIGEFRIRFPAAGACTPPPVAQSLTIGPADAATFDLALAPDGWRGQAVVEGTTPFALVGEQADGDRAMLEAVASTPAGARPDVGGPLAAVLALPAGRHRLTFDILNTGRGPFAPRVTVFDRAGRTAPPILPPLTGGALCPGGHWTMTVELTVADAAAEGYLVWIEGPTVRGDGLAATVQVATLDPSASGATGDTVRSSYDLTASAASGATQLADIPPVALPAGFHDQDRSGHAHTIAVARTGSAVGQLDYVVQLYDRNGIVERICRTLSGAATDVIDLSALPGLPGGTQASAVVAAVRWSGAEPPGELAATALWDKASFGAPLQGDALAAVAGMPLDAPWAQAAAGAPCGPQTEPPPPPVSGAAPLRAAAFMPAVHYVGGTSACSAAITVTNTGTAPAQILRILWAETNLCEPDCDPPRGIGCTPLIAPGASFTFFERSPAHSGVLLSLDGRSLDVLGAVPGDTRTAAEVLCADARLVESCQGWRQLWLAWQSGSTFAALPLDRVVGPPFTAEVMRTCQTGGDTPARGSDGYTAPSAAEVFGAETQADRFVYSVTDVTLTGSVEPNRQDATILYLQNAGMRCASVTVQFASEASATGPSTVRCNIATLSAGESFQLDVDDCVDRPWRGTVVLSSDQPMAVALDRHTNPLASGGVERGAQPPPTADANATATRSPGGGPSTVTPTPRFEGTATETPTSTAPPSTPSPTRISRWRIFLPRVTNGDVLP